MIKKILLAVLAAVLLLAAAVAVNTVRKGSRQLSVPLAAAGHRRERRCPAPGAGGAAEDGVLASDAQLNADQFQALHALLEAVSAGACARLKREVVGGLSLLYTWPGSDPQAKPILLMAHQDVVPIALAPRATGSRRSGAVADGYVWGRGSWDDKGNLLSQLEAVELLLAAGSRRAPSIWPTAPTRRWAAAARRRSRRCSSRAASSWTS
jgi:carboxypeptidase PM20D1